MSIRHFLSTAVALLLVSSASLGFAADKKSSCHAETNKEAAKTAQIAPKPSDSTAMRAQPKLVEETSKTDTRRFGRHGRSAMARQKILRNDD
jgi:hypothetical protein